jgi:hypothetical protein
MTKHAAAMVKWDVFRPKGGTGGAAVYGYGSNQERLLQRVADGGTLWLMTNRRIRGTPTAITLLTSELSVSRLRRKNLVFHRTGNTLLEQEIGPYLAILETTMQLMPYNYLNSRRENPCERSEIWAFACLVFLSLHVTT